MNRYNQLKRLKDEVGRLFSDGVDENLAFEQLRADPSFATVSHADVKSFYKRMKKKAELENEMTEIRRIKKLCQNSEDFLFYDALYGYVHILSVWQSRFSLDELNEEQKDNTSKVTLVDFYQRKSKTFEIPKTGTYSVVHMLTYPFFLFFDGSYPAMNGHVQLVRFNPEDDSMQIIQTVDGRHRDVYVDSCDSSKFVLDSGNQVQICKLTNGQVQTVKMRQNNHNLNEGRVSYFEDCIYDLDVYWGDDDNEIFEMYALIWDLNNDESESVELNLLPGNLVFANFSKEENYIYSEWIRDKLFAPVKFVLTNGYSIAFTDLQTKNWSVINFAIDRSIYRMHFVSGKDLLIHVIEGSSSKTSIYKLSLCKPDPLRNMAWLKLLNLFKQAEVKDPYAEARKYLPLNSDIQPFIFTEE